MAETTSNRIGVNFTDADIKLVRKLKLKLASDHGKLTTTAVLRQSLRHLDQSLSKSS